LYGIKFHFEEEVTSGNLPPQQWPSACAHLLSADVPAALAHDAVREAGMPEIKIITEVSGRVCALPVDLGASVGSGDEVAFIEAMKMEIPVASPIPGRLKAILVQLDDIVAEGQAIAILES
jgi:biotin carboxyl carrier protein